MVMTSNCLLLMNNIQRKLKSMEATMALMAQDQDSELSNQPPARAEIRRKALNQEAVEAKNKAIAIHHSQILEEKSQILANHQQTQ